MKPFRLIISSGQAAALQLAILVAAGLGAVPVGTPQAQAGECDNSPQAGIDWSGCRKRNLILEGSDLSGANLGDADFTSTDLRNALFEKTDFSKATLVRSMLDQSRAAGANFEKAVGFRTSFAGTNLAGSNFVKSEMQRADFTGADLSNVDFQKSELGRASFSKANIEGTGFRYANLARADFRDAVFQSSIDFTGAYLYRTRLENVDMSKAIGLNQWQLDMSCGNGETRLPEGLIPPDSWPCEEE
ncbi:MAG: pentapeptide repeat-containing protein [Nitratireductor sp.]|nr:pentapeptide repeat-containing protein [Nitratireductor sp.]